MQSDRPAHGLQEILCHYVSTEPDAWLLDDLSFKVRRVHDFFRKAVPSIILLSDSTPRDQRSGYWQNERGDIVYLEYELGRSILIYRRIWPPSTWIIHLLQGKNS